MTLTEKLNLLRASGLSAIRVADGWLKQVDKHGEQKVEAFYRHIGLNHIERKGIEWEGLTLSREPKDAEKIAVKGIAQAQDLSKELLIKVLNETRRELLSDGLQGIVKYSPANYHALILQVSSESRTRLRDRLMEVYKQGRILVQTELNRANKQNGDDFDELDDLVDLTDSRLANDVQSRIIAAAARFSLLGLADAALNDAINRELQEGSTNYIDRAATGLANRTISIGRGDEMEDHADEIDRYQYSAILDVNTCGPCLEDDGLEASDADDLPDTPNPECEGLDYCRCFQVAIIE